MTQECVLQKSPWAFVEQPGVGGVQGGAREWAGRHEGGRREKEAGLGPQASREFCHWLPFALEEA